MKTRTGFTLIELLVVLSIISLLSSMIFVRVAQARQKAKSNAAITQMRALQAAFELYKNDVGEYPRETATFWPEYYNYYFGTAADGITPYIGSYLAPKYIKKLPFDVAYDTTASGKFYYGYVTGQPNLSSAAAKCGDKNMKSYLFIFLAGGNGFNVPDTSVTGFDRFDSNTSFVCFGV